MKSSIIGCYYPLGITRYGWPIGIIGCHWVLVANLGGRCWVGGVGDVKLNVFLAKFIIKKKKKKNSLSLIQLIYYSQTIILVSILYYYLFQILFYLFLNIFFFSPHPS